MREGVQILGIKCALGDTVAVSGGISSIKGFVFSLKTLEICCQFFMLFFCKLQFGFCGKKKRKKKAKLFPSCTLEASDSSVFPPVSISETVVQLPSD